MAASYRLAIFLTLAWNLSCVSAEQPSPQIEPILPELASPAAITVRPGGNQQQHELFVADGDGRILRVASDAPDRPQEILTGFPHTPAVLQFINGRTLVVASVEAPPVLRAYEIPDDGKTLNADQRKFELRSTTSVTGATTSMTVGTTAVFVAGAGSDTGWVLRSRLRSGMPGDLKTFVDTTTKNGSSRPTCLAMSLRGWLVVGDAGRQDAGEDSRLTFYHPVDSTAEPALVIDLNLLDVAAIAYSPQGMLYAADRAEMDTKRGGIYRIDMTSEPATIGGKAVRIVTIEHPRAMSFAPDGTLYVIARDDDNRTNKLLRVTGLE